MNPKISLHNLYEYALEFACLREDFNIVMNALNRLEELEKENQEFKEYFDKIASGDTIINLFRENHNFKKGLEKAIKENKLKSIEFRNKNDIHNSMIFNQICVILETILNGVKEC